MESAAPGRILPYTRSGGMPHTFPQRTAININCNRLSTNSPKKPSISPRTNQPIFIEYGSFLYNGSRRAQRGWVYIIHLCAECRPDPSTLVPVFGKKQKLELPH